MRKRLVRLHPGFYQSLLEDTTKNRYELVDKALIRSVYRSRKKFAHKGDYGHALLVAGSYGKTGAAILAAKACLRSGVGLLTTHIPQSSYAILQSSVPESMVFADPAPDFLTRMAEDITKYAALGIGPGIGMAEETKKLLQEIIKSYDKPVVLDADALNIIAGNKELFGLLPAGSILTPHPKEFERLFGKAANDFDRALLALEKAKELRCVIIVKGHHSFIATAAGKGFFNSTGNPGMATAGSGDVLTGILTGLLAQGYGAIEASILGVYLHGLAGGLAAGELSMESMIAGDIIENLGKAFLQIREPF